MQIKETAKSLLSIVSSIAIASLNCPESVAGNINTNSDEIGNADIVLSISGPNSIDIGIGRITEGIRHPRFFPKEQLQAFFKRERQKELLLVCCQRASLVDKELRDFLHSLGFKKVIECSLKADDIYAARRKLTRKVNEHDQMATYHGLRVINCVGGADGLSMDILTETQSQLHPDLTHVKDEQFFSREELLPFLQQDVQRQFLIIILAKNAHSAEVELKSFTKNSHFPHFEFEKARGIFQVEPKVIWP